MRKKEITLISTDGFLQHGLRSIFSVFSFAKFKEFWERMKMKNILITGARGFIGSELVKHLPKENIKIFEGDITNALTVSEAIKGVDKIIHLAAITNPYHKDIYKINIIGTKNLVLEAKRNKVKKFIYISTESVLSKNQNAYTFTKLKTEEIVKTFKNHVILRPTLVYGLGDKKYIEKTINLIKRLPIIPLFGNGRFQPIYIEDLIKNILEALKPEIKGTYIIAGISEVSFKEFINHIQDIYGTKKPIIKIPPILIKPFIYIYQKISKNPIITISQINNMNETRTHNVKQISKHKPTDLIEGLKKSIRGKYE